MIDDPREFLISLFNAAVAAADPEKMLGRFLPEPPSGRTIVIGAGKGSAQMARAFENAWQSSFDGVVVTRYGYAAKCERIRVIEAAHPVPDDAGLKASDEILAAVSGLDKSDLVVALISGGGSALLPAPAGELVLDDEIALNKALLASGAPISAMNTIRKHVSRIKGGRLAAAAYPARVVSLIISDIPGDNPAHVASGPTVPDWGSAEDAIAAIERYRIKLPDRVLAHISAPGSGAPTPDDPRFAGNEHHIIASAAVSLQTAAEAAKKLGINAVILSDSIEGEAREVARVHAAISREVSWRDRPFSKPVLILSGGETTVTVRGEGKGGRNTEFLLSLAMDISGLQGISALAADTDGIDGSQDNAGAFADCDTIQKLRRAGIDPALLLNNNDAWTAFETTGDLFVPGPTGTNVNDFRAILIQ